MRKLKLEPPWNAYQKKVNALFEEDPDIIVGEIFTPQDTTDATYAMNIEVKKHEKYLALTKFLPTSVSFGNVKMDIIIYDKEDVNGEALLEEYKKLFEGNRRVKDIKSINDFAGTPHVFIRFQPEVVQFYHDDISDYNGNWSGLAQDIARELFNDAPWNVHFCTADLRENDDPSAVDTPLGEWP